MPRPGRNRNWISLPAKDRIKDGRVFEISKRTDRGVIYLRCRTKFCGGTAKKMSPNGDIIVQREHSAIFFEDPNAHSEANFKHALKDMLSRQFWKLKDLYETVVAMYPRAIKILVPYNSIVSSLKRWRKQNYPPCPKSLEEMAEQLVQPDNDRLIQYDTGRLVTEKIFDNNGKLHLLLYDPEFIRDEFQNVTRIFIDGTFQTTPRVTGVYQLVSILGVKYDHVLPFAHILMSKKTECAYMAVLTEIKKIIDSASVAVVMTDFEQGLRNAARSTFVNAHIAGCSVHYDRV